MKNRSIKDVVATFSIVAADPETEELGIAVQSKFIAVGSVVPWAKAGLGAVDVYKRQRKQESSQTRIRE